MGITYSKEVDSKWQNTWKEKEVYKYNPNSDKEKLYLMEMFSYPSAANLHLGHWWNFGLSDSWGRMKRMQGYEVFHPMGFDAFGLPAENYAIKTGIHPKDSTDKNIATMKVQLSKMGATYDWDYEIETCEPEYYKWTQWLFLQLYHKGLAYRKEAPVNWCPKCKTVLANEQAFGGKCERCDSFVEQKDLTQWFFKITEYAEELLQGLDVLDWPEQTKQIQRNWIGRSQGAEIDFQVSGFNESVTVFTTRIDTIMGVSYLVLAPEHPLVNSITSNEQKKAVEAYQTQTKLKTEIERTSISKEKTGEFIGAYAIHPITNEQIPIWISDYVVASYGTGAVMAVPAHDSRDYMFAKKYDLPIQTVIRDESLNAELPYCEKGTLIHSGEYNGMSSDEAMEAIIHDLQKVKAAEEKVSYRLRDWLVSRQRYWGAPIPIFYCEHCGTVPVPEKDLPVELPYHVNFKPGDHSPLADCEEFVNTVCPCCGKPAKRETDTLDTFVCSSWYYLRYPDPKNSEKPWDWEKIKDLMPVDKYIGGIEHAAMHLLYARFFYKALRDMGHVEGAEPFRSLIHQGIILGPDGQKMSKSRGNTVSPDAYIEMYGSDVFRTYLTFGFSYKDGGPWSDSGIKAVKTFFDKISRMFDSYLESPKNSNAGIEENLESIRHKTIKAVTKDTENFQFNTAIARLMEFRSAISDYQRMEQRSSQYEKEVIIDFLKLLSPFAPHFTEEIWAYIGDGNSIFQSNWPTYDDDKLDGSSIEIMIQINSKNKCKMTLPSSITEEDMKAAAIKCEDIQCDLKDKTIKKVICIKGRLVNIVI